MRFCLAVCLTASLIVCGSLAIAQPVQSSSSAAIANPSNDPLVFYRAYEAASQQGDAVAAYEAVVLAWQTGERVWPSDNPNLPGMAFTAAWSAALLGKPVERIDAARRAVALAPLARGFYTLPEAEFVLAYADYFSTPQGERRRVGEKLAAAALPIEGTWEDFMLAKALVNASAVVPNGRQSLEIANRALVAIERTKPNDTSYKALALMARAQGRLAVGDNRDEALADMIEARIAYGPMRATNDSIWDQLLVWKAGIGSITRQIPSTGRAPSPTVSRSTNRPLEITPSQLLILDRRPGNNGQNSVQCERLVRDRSVGDSFDAIFSRQTNPTSAAFVFRYDLDSGGKAVNPYLAAAAASSNSLGARSLRALSSWKFIIPAGTPPSCLKQQYFVMSLLLME